MAELVYVYGLIPTKETEDEPVTPFQGLDGKHDAYTVQINKITAVICNLDEEDYAEAQIKEKINNNMVWLQEKAFHHHEVLMALLKQYTVVPMKFCTIYSNMSRMQAAVVNNEKKITDSFAVLDRNEEWNLKIYCDDSTLKDHISRHSSEIDTKRAEISQLPPGRQYFEKRKMDQFIEQQLEREKDKISEQVHDELKQFALHDAVKKNLNKDVTGRKDSMSWNSVYLIPTPQVEGFLEEMNLAQDKLAECGWKFEASGPWPAYHFASLT